MDQSVSGPQQYRQLASQSGWAAETGLVAKNSAMARWADRAEIEIVILVGRRGPGWDAPQVDEVAALTVRPILIRE